MQGLQTSYGALAQFFEKDDRVALEDGLKLLGSSSTILASQLQKAELFCAQDPKYSSFRPLEEWLRLKAFLAASPQSGLPPVWVGQTMAQIFFVWDFLLQQAQSLFNNPMLANSDEEIALSQEFLEESLRLRNEANQKLASLDREALLKSPDQNWLAYKDNLEQLQEAVEAAHKSLERQIIPFKELPGLERILGLKESVKRNDQDRAPLKAEFEQQLKRVEELLRSVEGAKDPISREFSELLPVHRSAYMGMIENLEEGDWYSLDARWQGIVSTLPRLSQLSRAVRQRLQSQGSSSKLIPCLRCGYKNEPHRRVCSACGANLPAVVQKMQEFSEIDTSSGLATSTESAAPVVAPTAIELLENLVSNLEGNRVSKSQGKEALDILVKDVERQRQLFTKKLLPMMGKDEKLDSYLRYFAQGLGQYFGNLMTMQQTVVEGTLAQLHSSLSETRDTLETLDAMKQRIDEALRT